MENLIANDGVGEIAFLNKKEKIEESLRTTYRKKIWKNFIKAIKDLIHNKFDSELEIVISADDCLDLNIKGCSKRGGVEYISQELKINPKEIMAFGDSGNDYKMLKFVGHPVAMKDSFMSKRDFENKTDFTNDESGVAKYLQKYFNL